MSEQIDEVQKGSTPTLLHADFANKLIKMLNVIAAMEVSIEKAEENSGEFQTSKGNAKLILKLKLGGIPDPPTSGTYVLGAVEGAIQWIDTTACPS